MMMIIKKKEQNRKEKLIKEEEEEIKCNNLHIKKNKNKFHLYFDKIFSKILYNNNNKI
jgi:Zn-dependent peptidase ImmA (M78 family)